MDLKAVILDDKAMKRALARVSHEIIEKNKGVEDIILIGVKRRGVPLAQRIAKNIEEFEGVKVPVGCVDITLYRDDLSTLNEDPNVNNDKIEVEIKDKKVIIVDDVIYTGRTVRASIDAVLHNGRPNMIQLAVMVDRGHRELPIRPDYVGKNIPTSHEEIVSVAVSEIDGEDSVKIYEV